MLAIRLAAALLALGAVAPASAADLYVKPARHAVLDDGSLPPCADASVTGTIAHRFAAKESEYWHSDLVIQGFDRQHEIAYRPWGESYIPRRFCEARALTSDGHYRTVSYAIGENLGIIGWSWGVEWCVAGVDRNLAYAPACKMAQP